MNDILLFKIEIIAEARVDHHAPCVPWCTVCYPCEQCGIVHALNMHDQPSAGISETIQIGTSSLMQNRDDN